MFHLCLHNTCPIWGLMCFLSKGPKTNNQDSLVRRRWSNVFFQWWWLDVLKKKKKTLECANTVFRRKMGGNRIKSKVWPEGLNATLPPIAVIISLWHVRVTCGKWCNLTDAISKSKTLLCSVAPLISPFAQPSHLFILSLSHCSSRLSDTQESLWVTPEEGKQAS